MIRLEKKKKAVILKFLLISHYPWAQWVALRVQICAVVPVNPRLVHSTVQSVRTLKMSFAQHFLYHFYKKIITI